MVYSKKNLSIAAVESVLIFLFRDLDSAHDRAYLMDLDLRITEHQ